MSESDNAIPQFSRDTAICTLFEGDYHYGLAAFVNSLVHANYDGTVWVGYRGALPPWLNQLKRLDPTGREYLVGKHTRLVFLPLEIDIHFASYKPRFMLNLLADQASDAQYLWYFDPDICLRCDWSFFTYWQRCGIALCQELILNTLPADSPLRHKWMDLASAAGLTNPRPMNHYLNSGMLGLSAAHQSFLNLWQTFTDIGRNNGADMHSITSDTRANPFHVPDQDAFNMAAMYTEHPLSTMGPEAMGFTSGAGFTMYHAVGPKPWKGSVLGRALKGTPPSNGTKFFFTKVSSPIRAYTPMQLRGKKLSCAIGAAIGRFYHRNK